MSLRYKSFVEDVWSNFPGLKQVKNTDITNYNYFWTLKQHIDVGYLNFLAGRKYLYRLSVLLENYAVRNQVPLLATFETEKRYKYVEDRYTELLEKIPKARPKTTPVKRLFMLPPCARQLRCFNRRISQSFGAL